MDHLSGKPEAIPWKSLGSRQTLGVLPDALLAAGVVNRVILPSELKIQLKGVTCEAVLLSVCMLYVPKRCVHSSKVNGEVNL